MANDTCQVCKCAMKTHGLSDLRRCARLLRAMVAGQLRKMAEASERAILEQQLRNS